MDLLAVGPVVQDLSRSFDLYWNSEWAYPIEAFRTAGSDPAALRKGLEDLAAHRAAAQDSDTRGGCGNRTCCGGCSTARSRSSGLPRSCFADRPEKVAGDESPVEVVKLGARLRPLVEKAGTEVIISSPYFIPGKAGMQLFEELREKGVRVRIMTNSFAGNDVAVVHSGYARYRKDLLRLGVELFELKPSFGAKGKKSAFGSSGVSLHAKVFVIDREQAFVGSLNLDPRSVDLNTELGIVVESPALADEIARKLESLLRPAFSYRAVSGRAGRGSALDGRGGRQGSPLHLGPRGGVLAQLLHVAPVRVRAGVPAVTGSTHVLCIFTAVNTAERARAIPTAWRSTMKTSAR